MERRQTVRWRAAALALLVLAIGVAVGALVGAWAASLVEPVPFTEPEADDEWTGLLFTLALLELPETPALVGGVVGVLVGGATWAVGLLGVARRLLPRRRTGAPVLAALATAWGGSAVVLLVWGAARGAEAPPSLAAVTAVVGVLTLAGCAVFGQVAARVAAGPAERVASLEVIDGWLTREPAHPVPDGDAAPAPTASAHRGPGGPDAPPVEPHDHPHA
ncbi:hypothetical protein GXB85_12805 [Cellulomonas sp. APG4]|uniref:hypothetical protein n=1 Tax=Cellulomonas sp. APG4 TaxID=1538656 RepID=UPI00137995C5|nr:hypothetical protein [Cellulomonas sp. APG4]NCT91825.1 hypothetical protein [Cellulomonas sp. APG4]